MSTVLSLRVRITLWMLVALFILALTASAVALVWSTRQNALDTSQEQVRRFVAVAEAAINRSFLSVDVLLAGTEDLLHLSQSVPEQIRAPGASALLRSTTRSNLMVRSLALLDEQGQVLASSDHAGARLSLKLPPGFIAQVLAPSLPTLVVSPSAVSFASAEQVLYFSRYFRLADGSRLLAVAEVPTAILVAVLLQGVDIAGLEVMIERSPGQLLLSVPDRGTLANVSASASASASKAATHLTTLPALVVAQPLLYQDLALVASLPVAAALADWQGERRSLVATMLALGLLALLAGFFAQSYLRRITVAQLAIAQSKATLDQALESMVSGFVLLDAQRCVLQWNHRFEEMFPWLASTMVRKIPFRSVLEVSVQHHLPDASEIERKHWLERRLAIQAEPQGPYEQMLPNGHCVQVTERITPEGGMVIIYHDVTDLRRASAEIEILAFYDPLTGLANRRLLLDRLGQAASTVARSGNMGAVLYLDLDHFKVLNDTQGHELGDQLLRQVAQRLQAGLRDSDTVARLGGDEFVVILTDLAPDSQEAAAQAQRVGEKLLFSLGLPYTLGEHVHHGSCSIGATLFGHKHQSAAELLKQADIAMYQVKGQSGNGLCFFDPQMQTLISWRAQLEADLQVALGQNQLALHYQPQFARDGSMVGAEALLRWQHPERGMVSPGEFIPVAEESGLIVLIGQWVLRTACQQLAAWQSDPVRAQLQVAVNVSARQFRQRDFVQQVIEVMQATGIRPHLLKLELTESLVLDNVDDTIDKMHQLRTKGVRFSVDDFGTGYSSLAYLSRLPLHQLKIDQSFVRNLGIHPNDDVIVQTIIGMAGNLGLEVIAEGVETLEQKEFLERYGCELYQGYLLGRPMPVAQLEILLAQHSAAVAG
ncbi:MAG: EAL domain-containing protein [Rhodoferax sp.]|nr:EAL domain-containing protein [Rhodoferax sp.]